MSVGISARDFQQLDLNETIICLLSISQAIFRHINLIESIVTLYLTLALPCFYVSSNCFLPVFSSVLPGIVITLDILH